MQLNLWILYYIEDTIFITNQAITQEYFNLKKVYNKQCNRDGKLQMMLQKTISLFSQA